MKEKKEQKTLIIEIDSSLNDAKFDDVKDSVIVKNMWDELALVHRDDHNVLRKKNESLKEIIDDMSVTNRE